MGANVINTIAEYVSHYICDKVLKQGRVSLRILSNLCVERMTLAEFTIPVEQLSWKDASGESVASKILEAQRFAELD